MASSGGDNVESEYRELVEEVLTCTRCPLHLSRRNAVPGEGPLSADVMVVGEAPGKREDETGRPFVGAAGRLLDELLREAGLDRREVYITNVVKCRPPGNRDPSGEEIAACRGYLERQIRLVRPKLVIAVGRIAGSTVYSMAGLRWASTGRERGRIRRVRIAGVEVALLTTYHPAAALYNPQLREELFKDFRGPIRRAVESVKRGGAGKATLDDYLAG